MVTEKQLMRYDIINILAEKIEAQYYLEIGVQNKNNCFNKIKVKHKVCVDPDIKADPDWCMTSDEFFENSKDKYDIIFIDGLHHADQVYKDINNALEHLTEKGIIICHDMNPEKEEIQRVPRETKEWTGDCWKAFVKLRKEQLHLDMLVVNTDYGVGVIKKSKDKHYFPKILLDVELTYENLVIYRRGFLNLLPVEQFKDYASRLSL